MQHGQARREKSEFGQRLMDEETVRRGKRKKTRKRKRNEEDDG